MHVLVDGCGPDVRGALDEAEVAAAVSRGDVDVAVDAAARLAADDTERVRLERAARLEAFRHVRTAARTDWPPAPVEGFADPYAIPEIAAADLTANTLTAGLQGNGSLVLRGLLDADECEGLRSEIDHVFAVRDEVLSGVEVPADGTYERWPFSEQMARSRMFVELDRSGVLTADAPRAASRLVHLYRQRGVLAAVAGYLGEPPALSLDKWTLRRVPPEANTGWHQDGAFLGTDVRTVNVWLALTDCGVDAAGLDLVPFRLDDIVETGTGDTYFDWGVGHDVVLRVAGEHPPVSPVFRAGDAILFDQFSLHRTGIRPGMTKTRYAVEAWFFAPSHFPEKYDGILL